MCNISCINIYGSGGLKLLALSSSPVPAQFQGWAPLLYVYVLSMLLLLVELRLKYVPPSSVNIDVGSKSPV